jgi:hypothetical protein
MSIPMKPDDPAYWMLLDDFTSTPIVHLDGCYICEDPEFAQMGLPLCRKCSQCVKAGRGSGHIAADDTVCDVCGYDEIVEYDKMMEEREKNEPS